MEVEQARHKGLKGGMWGSCAVPPPPQHTSSTSTKAQFEEPSQGSKVSAETWDREDGSRPHS